MFNQKGQILIIILVLAVIGFVLYANFFSSNVGKLFKKTQSAPQSSPAIIPAPVPASVPAPVPTPAPVDGVIPDKAPPVRLNPQPIGVLPAGLRKTILSLATNEKATCRHSNVAGVHYDSMQGGFSQTNSAFHSVLITTLSEGGLYKYYIKCADEKGNKNMDDLVISFGVGVPEDKAPPVLSNPSHTGNVLPIGTKEVIISISTNEPASCRYSIIGGLPYSSMSESFSYYDQTERFHVKQITGLVSGVNYDFFVRCQDLAGNSNTGDVLINFNVGY